MVGVRGAREPILLKCAKLNHDRAVPAAQRGPQVTAG
jgi:hypothetical protein